MVRFIFMRRDYTYIVTDAQERFVSSHRTIAGAKRVVRACNTEPDLAERQPYKAEKVKCYR